ncbi:shikimate kinase [Winogradskyella sediminis]|uniref:shikimate kinase n=1 Tax=Winogradskyella sediminis TaxID=1382466 RepID=UPI003AA82BB3
MIIVLIGYMGSGKSTIGKALATKLNCKFLDLDDYISDKENTSISNLFIKKGEIYFRKKETEYLKELVNSSQPIVLALGGGTPCYGNNMTLLTETPHVVSFYLKLSIPLLAKRLFNERDTRPLISHLEIEAELSEFIGKHLFERTQYYSKSDFTLQTDYKSEQEILEDLMSHLV